MKRNGAIHKAIKNFAENQKYARTQWQKIRKILQSLPERELPENTRISADQYGIYLYVPWGLDNLAKTRQAIGSEWELSHQHESKDGSLCKQYSYKPYYASLTIVMDATQLTEGTCQKIKVGEETRTVEIFKVVCA